MQFVLGDRIRLEGLYSHFLVVKLNSSEVIFSERAIMSSTELIFSFFVLSSIKLSKDLSGA